MAEARGGLDAAAFLEEWPEAAERAGACRLQIGDTAECNSALQGKKIRGPSVLESCQAELAGRQGSVSGGI
jgi:hypothetical protein